MYLDSMSDPKVMLRKTVTMCAMMLAAWAALIGTITIVMLVAISHAKGEMPATSAVQEDVTTQTPGAPATPKLDNFHPNHAPQVKASTRI
jgi:hypothetical protein